MCKLYDQAIQGIAETLHFRTSQDTRTCALFKILAQISTASSIIDSIINYSMILPMLVYIANGCACCENKVWHLVKAKERPHMEKICDGESSGRKKR